MDKTRQAEVTELMKGVQASICQGLSEATGDEFSKEKWDYKQGSGGGITRVVCGKVLEKGGVNFSGLEGVMNPKIAKIMRQEPNTKFFATGISLVIHPLNPFVPTTHMNVRYFETSSRWWIGGGIDLTPYYPNRQDVLDFHQTLKDVCDKHDKRYYSRFKKWCDEYFFLKHRNETRGIGGIFYDYISDDWQKNISFNNDVGHTFLKCYLPFIEKYKDKEFSEQQKSFQLYRRGRYAEFNLIYDRGTKFGLETQGRTESILMSLPPQANWIYDWKPEADSLEAGLDAYLRPQDWI